MAADGSIVFSIGADDAEAQKKLNQLRRDIEKTAKSLDENMGKRNALADRLSEARAEAEKTADYIKELQAQYQENAGVLSGRTGDVDPAEFAARQQAQAEITRELRIQEALYAKQTAAVAKLEGEEQAITNQIATQTAQLGEQQTAAGEIENTFVQTSTSALPQLHGAIENVNKSIKKGFRNILKWGFGIRSTFILMRRLRNAIKEGIKTFAEYDDETKANIDSLKSSLSSLKASWGAAFAPILNAVAPMLQKLISLLITAANYVQMFFAALRGGTSYKKIIKNNDNLAKSYGGAGGAAEEAKKSVMGFDELNKLDDQSSGGGGGGGGGAAENAFDTETLEIPEEFLKKVEWLKEHFKDILGIAAGIAALLLAWKISSMLGVPFLKVLQVMLGIIMAIVGAVILVKNYIDAWKNGVDWDNLMGILGGTLLLVLGLALAFGSTAAAIGLLIAGVAMLVLGFREWITTGELTDQTFILIAAGIAAVGIAIGLLTGSWIPLLIAVIAMLVLTVIKYWDEIKAFTIKVWTAIKDAIVNAWNAVKTWTVNTWNNIKNAIVNAINAIITKITAFKSKISEAVTNIVNKVTDLKNKFVDKFNAIRDKAQEIINKVKEFFSFNWQLPHIRLPHLTVQWQPAGDLAQFFGISAIPHLGIEWYARGGIVDGATLIGAGEAGKEAIVPLERNTEWVDMVSKGIIDGLIGNNRFADAITGAMLPALANGQIVPPRALGSNGSLFSDSDIDRLVNGIVSAFTMTGGENNVTKLYLDGREIATCVTKHQRQMARGLT